MTSYIEKYGEVLLRRLENDYLCLRNLNLDLDTINEVLRFVHKYEPNVSWFCFLGNQITIDDPLPEALRLYKRAQWVYFEHPSDPSALKKRVHWDS